MNVHSVSIIFISILLFYISPYVVTANNHYFDNALSQSQIWPYPDVTTTKANQILFKRFGSKRSHQPIYNENGLPQGIKKYCSISASHVPILDQADYMADNLHVLGFAENGELFPVTGDLDIMGKIDPLNHTPKAAGIWFTIQFEGNPAYIHAEPVDKQNIDGKFPNAVLHEIKPTEPLKEETSSISGWVLIGIIIVLIVIVASALSDFFRSKSSSTASSYSDSGNYDSWSPSTLSASSSDSQDDREQDDSRTDDDFYVRCPSCNGPDFSTLFKDKGDGVCKACKGSGENYDVGDLAKDLIEGKVDQPSRGGDCQVCSGTGQCQMCGGTGEVRNSRL